MVHFIIIVLLVKIITFCAIDFRSQGNTNVKCVIKRSQLARKFEFAGRTSAHKLAALTKSCVQTNTPAPAVAVNKAKQDVPRQWRSNQKPITLGS
jgi:hypothetical protein